VETVLLAERSVLSLRIKDLNVREEIGGLVVVRRLFPGPILVTIAIIITLITGLLIKIGPSFYYGVPLGWRLDSCPLLLLPSPYGWCLPYIWWAFIVDVLFYAAVGYGLLLGYAKYHQHGKSLFMMFWTRKRQLTFPKGTAIMEIA
jgi:hypothetical protein